MSHPALGFVGFGEAGFHIAKGFKTAGIAGICAFDINRDTPELAETIRRRAKEVEIRLVDSSKELAVSSAILFSTVTCARAKEAAEQTAPFLKTCRLHGRASCAARGATRPRDGRSGPDAAIVGN